MIKYLFLLLICLRLVANPIGNTLETGRSYSGFYDSKSVFLNPAALAYQTELNGTGLSTSFSYAINRLQNNEFSLGLSYGYIGFGAERLSVFTQNFSRFTIAGAIPLSSTLFLGSRYSFTHSDYQSLNNLQSFDLGLQFRPFSFLSAALATNQLNKTFQTVASLSVMPFSQLLISVDFDTPSNDFAKTLGYQANCSYEFLKGISVSTGYHKEYLFQFGLQVDFAKASVFSNTQPSSDKNRWVNGFIFAPIKNESILKNSEMLSLVIDSSFSEVPSSASFFSADKPNLIETLDSLRKIKNSPSFSGVVLKLESFPLGLASAYEIADALLKIRETGKRVEVYLGNANLKSYLIASSATEVVLEKSGHIEILGIKTERFYAKGLLDKIGIQGEFLAKGEYKSAPEIFTRKTSSPHSSKATQEELDELEKEILVFLKKSRKLNETKWNEILKLGLFTSEEALKTGLIDTIGSYQRVLENNKLTQSVEYKQKYLSLPNRVAVLTASGSIMGSKNKGLSLIGEKQITPDGMNNILEKALNDEKTKAIVFRVNSPGGEILASQEMADLITKANEKKPIVISMGDVAASGGYFISAPIKPIFASPLTITGSIGVFVGKFSLEKLYQKLELKKEITGKSPLASLYSEAKTWSPAEKIAMQRLLNRYYDQFVKFVALNRSLSIEVAEAAAKGRVWTGTQAIKHQIVNHLGGLNDSIEFAAEIAGLKNFEVFPITRDVTLLESLGVDSLFGRESSYNLENLPILNDWLRLNELSAMGPLYLHSPFL